MIFMEKCISGETFVRSDLRRHRLVFFFYELSYQLFVNGAVAVEDMEGEHFLP